MVGEILTDIGASKGVPRDPPYGLRGNSFSGTGQFFRNCSGSRFSGTAFRIFPELDEPIFPEPGSVIFPELGFGNSGFPRGRVVVTSRGFGPGHGLWDRGWGLPVRSPGMAPGCRTPDIPLSSLLPSPRLPHNSRSLSPHPFRPPPFPRPPFPRTSHSPRTHFPLDLALCVGASLVASTGARRSPRRVWGEYSPLLFHTVSAPPFSPSPPLSRHLPLPTYPAIPPPCPARWGFVAWLRRGPTKPDASVRWFVVRVWGESLPPLTVPRRVGASLAAS